ncbi:MAG: hypothetical protein U0P81_06920 [Holophagaceae bacterium]
MPRSLAPCLLGALALGAQEPAYFQEPERPWWRPQGVLLLEVERLPSLSDDYVQDATRVRALLELGWSRSWKAFTADVAMRGAVGSDGNVHNLDRYDQRPSNGAWLQRALLRADLLREHAAASVTLGLQGNPLLSSESYWDHDLALEGTGVRAGYRDEGRGILEAGFRGVMGRVRSFPDQRVQVRGAQAVLRLERGPVAWTAHLDRWEVHWDAGDERFDPLPGGQAFPRQFVRLDVAGLGASGEAGLPWSAGATLLRNAITRETGSEVQAWLGPLARPFRPRAGVILQRLSATGTAFATGGDDWWFVGASRGSRVVVQLPLRHGARLALAQLFHRTDADPRTSKRTTLSLEWRF